MKTLTRTALALAISAAVFPAYSADLPQSAVLNYSGSYGIPAVMTFNRSGNSYKIVSTIKVPLYNIRFESGGTISGNTLKPSYYKDTRGGKLYAQAKFSGNSITYGKSGETHTENARTAMDLFTLAWQLSSSDGKLPAGLSITNGKKLYKIGGMNKIGSSSYKFAGGSTPVSKYRISRGDDTITYAFAAKLNNIPAQISYSDDGKTYNLKLTGLKINGKTVKP